MNGQSCVCHSGHQPTRWPLPSALCCRCGHCKSLKPEYEKAAKVLKADNVRIAKVDATAHQDLATKFDVSGFPTIKFFRGGQPSEYNGGRDKDSIVSWVRKRSGPATTTVTTSAQLESLTQGHDVVVISFVSAADSATAAAVSSVAAAHDDAPFALVIGSEGEAADIRTKYGVGADEEAVVAANNFVGQENIVRFAGEVGAEALGVWVAANSLPLVVVFSQETAPKIFRGDMKTHFLLFADEGEDAGAEHTAALAAFRAAAAANPGRCLFVRVPSFEDRVLGYFGINGDNLPAAVLVNMGEEGMKKYKYTDAFAPEGFTAFLDAYAAGTLKAWLKSEAAPNAEGELRVGGAAVGRAAVAGGAASKPRRFSPPFTHPSTLHLSLPHTHPPRPLQRTPPRPCASSPARPSAPRWWTATPMCCWRCTRPGAATARPSCPPGRPSARRARRWRAASS